MSATSTSQNPFTYLSVCSGFGGAELAFENLGWKCVAVAEIDSAARAVLKHRWPHVKNLGDFTKIGREDVGTIDALVGGTPCQSFSVAGLRGGLGDDRGNLSLEFLRLADRTRPRWILWENVPGVLSSTSHIAPDPCPPLYDLEGDNGPKDGTEIVVEDEYDADEDHAFACFLAGLSELGYGYAYRTLDAQYFGVPQRRRRVFVVGHLGDWRLAAAVLFERHCLQGNPPPSRKAGEGFTHELAPCIGASGRGFERGGDSRGQDPVVAEGKYWDGTDTADTLDASNASKQQMMPEKRRFQAIITGSLMGNGKAAGSATQQDAETGMLVPVAFKASHYTRGKDGEPSEIVPPLSADADKGDQDTIIAAFNNTGQGWWNESETATGLRDMSAGSGSKEATVVAFSAKDHGADALDDCSPTLRAGGFDKSHANSGNWPAVAFNLRGREGGSQAETADVASVRASSGGSSNSYVNQAIGLDEEQNAVEDGMGCLKARHEGGGFEGSVMTPAMQVRRLTPIECERLQGIPDNHTQVPYRGKPMADGPRYKMIGNGFAIPVVRWIGERIQMVERIPVDAASS